MSEEGLKIGQGPCPHNHFRDVETCVICESEEERDALQARLEAATAAVRALCEKHGDTYWGEEPSIPDMITYHLAGRLERLEEKAGKDERAADESA